MLPDRVSNPGPLTYESGALPIADVLMIQAWVKLPVKMHLSLIMFCHQLLISNKFQVLL